MTPEKSASSLASMGPPRVLVVDDSRTMRNLISELLQGSVETLQALDGLDALEKYPAFKPHIILLDMDMPRLGGLDVIRRVRDGFGDHDTFIIVLSGHEENDLKAEALNRGANDYLTKPFHPEELRARMGVAGRQVALTAELRGAYGRISAEIDLVATLQKQLLPSRDLQIEHLELTSLYRPSGQASGDYYDYFQMEDGRVRLVLADIAGKGARAAFLMAMVQAFFRLGKQEGHALEKSVSLINSHLIEVSPSGSDFATLFAGDIDLASGTFTYINAGHCPGLMQHPDGRTSRLEAQSYPLGFMPLAFVSEKASFEPGSGLFLYSDGMFEWEVGPGRMLALEEFLTQAELALSGDLDFLANLSGRLAMLGESPPAYLDDQTALWVRRSRQPGK